MLETQNAAMKSKRMKKFPLVYAVILNWNKLQETLACLESLSASDYANFRVVLVDNHSFESPAGIIRERFPQVDIIQNETNLGYTGGNNVGLKYAVKQGADYVWLLNNDAIVEKQSLSLLIQMAESDEKLGLLSPLIYFYNSPERIEFCGRWVDWEQKKILELNPEDWRVVSEAASGHNTVLTGTALLIKKEVIETIGFLDESFFAYYEDDDYSLRALRAGYSNQVCRGTKIYHKSPLLNTARAPYYFYYMMRNRYFFRVKHFGHHAYLDRWVNFIDLLFHMFKYSSICLLEGKYPSASAALDGSWSALRGVRGPWEKRVAMPRWLRAFIYPAVFLFSTNYLLCRFVKHIILRPTLTALKNQRTNSSDVEGGDR